MIRKLSIVFASGLGFAIVLLSAAWLIGGQAMMAHIAKDGGYSFTIDTDAPRGPTISRSFPFPAIETLTISAPVSLKFIRGDKAAMVVQGSEARMRDLLWNNGHLSLAQHAASGNDRLEVTITAPVFPALVMQGASDVDLADLDQPALAIDSAGAIDLTGKGRADRLTIDSKGAGSIGLADVAVRDATVRIAGAGDVDISASGKVDATISGAGSIGLHRKPEVLTSRVNGAGSIDQDY